jgi:hypothetical protein
MNHSVVEHFRATTEPAIRKIAEYAWESRDMIICWPVAPYLVFEGLL